MTKRKLTKSVVEKLEPQDRDVVLWDAALPGFGVRVKPSGVRSYIVQYRNRVSGASKRMTLGRHGPLLTFDQAKRRAREILVDAQRGDDPADARRSARDAPTVSALSKEYLERHARPNKREKSVREDERLLSNHIVPAIGAKRVAEVERRDIEEFRLGLKDRPYQANRALALVSKMFNLAVSWGWRDDNPASKTPKFSEERRDRWLSDVELARLAEALDTHPNQRAADAVRLQLLTGARIGEVLSAEKADFDLERGVWIKPAHQTKQKRREHLPLSDRAIELVGAVIARYPSSEFLIPGDRPDAPLTTLRRFWKKVLADAQISDYRLHDNRHTYASHLVSDGLSLEIVGRLLGHQSASTTKRYAHLADDPLREATTLFANKLDRLRANGS